LRVFENRVLKIIFGARMEKIIPPYDFRGKAGRRETTRKTLT
jgi:hypothetical protein